MMSGVCGMKAEACEMKRPGKDAPIGVFDSGVGGISVLRKMISLMPNENYIYYGDSANAPYGDRSDEEVLSLTVNVRAPISFCDEDVYGAMRPVLEKYDIGVVKSLYNPPLYYPADSEIVQTLLSVYREHTGDEKSQPLVIGGGTYAREMENAIAYGALYPGDPDVMHEADEFIRIDRLILTSKIYADAIYRLTVR